MLRRHAFILAAAPLVAKSRPTMRLRELRIDFEDHAYRTPYMFGGSVVDRVTLLNVTLTAEDAQGRTAQGFGSMPLGNAWAFPSLRLTYAQTLDAMKQLAVAAREAASSLSSAGHPIDLGLELEERTLAAAKGLSLALQLKDPIPKLAALVVNSPFDAALHDAYGKLLRRSVWTTYNPSFMPHDLSRYLGPRFANEYPIRYANPKPAPWVWLYHSVGASDPISPSDLKSRLNDGLPETLADWITYSGLRHLKIKLNGADRKADTERVIAIHREAVPAMARIGVKDWKYCVDFNERCPNVGFLLEFLRDLQQRIPDGFPRIQYIEQPTKRDLKADRQNTMHEAAKLRPVVIDESLTDLESLDLAQQLGYTGVALKACKGQTQTLIMAAAAAKRGMFLCVQDLTCPGASFLHSASITAHIKGVAAMEGNGRQYVPSANRSWSPQFPGIFDPHDGRIATRQLTRPGLGAV